MDPWWPDTTVGSTIEVHETDFNPDHQEFIGFLPPSDFETSMMDATLMKSARRIAAELVLQPRERRPQSDYDEEYLKRTAGCASWPRLRCAYCDCWKRPGEEVDG